MKPNLIWRPIDVLDDIITALIAISDYKRGILIKHKRHIPIISTFRVHSKSISADSR